VFAKHGLKNLIERINLGDFLSTSETANAETENLTVAARLRLSFEELGPTFVKFGQLLASRPDMIPDEYLHEMSILHGHVQPLPFSIIETVLIEHYGREWKSKFKMVDENPLGSASIAQVHRAQLITGEDVVIKVQRPGIVQTINDDLNVLYFIAELLVRSIPEVEPFNPIGMVDEYFRTLELETNFVVEANNMRKFSENFKNQNQIMIPKVYFDLTTERVLVMEAVQGLPLSHPDALKQKGIQADDVIRLGLKAYLKMVFVDGFFHGDLHAGNFFVLPENKIGLIDFGVVGRLNRKSQNAIVNMLIALSKEDYERLAFEYVDLAPYSELVDVDLFAKDLQSLISPYYGLTLKHANIGRILMSSSSIAGDHGLTVPTELMLFFKSIIAIEGLGYKILRDFDFLSFMLSQVSEVAHEYFQPVKMANEANHLFRESRQFLNALPRQLNLIMRRMNSPNYQTRIEISELHLMRKSLNQSFQLLFWGLVIGAFLISSTWILVHPSTWLVVGVPGLSLVGYTISFVLLTFAAINNLRQS
jgi:ubiquinone biosynthesis protein